MRRMELKTFALPGEFLVESMTELPGQHDARVINVFGRINQVRLDYRYWYYTASMKSRVFARKPSDENKKKAGKRSPLHPGISRVQN